MNSSTGENMPLSPSMASPLKAVKHADVAIPRPAFCSRTLVLLTERGVKCATLPANCLRAA